MSVEEKKRRRESAREVGGRAGRKRKMKRDGADGGMETNLARRDDGTWSVDVEGRIQRRISITFNSESRKKRENESARGGR